MKSFSVDAVDHVLNYWLHSLTDSREASLSDTLGTSFGTLMAERMSDAMEHAPIAVAVTDAFEAGVRMAAIVTANPLGDHLEAVAAVFEQFRFNVTRESDREEAESELFVARRTIEEMAEKKTAKKP